MPSAPPPPQKKKKKTLADTVDPGEMSQNMSPLPANQKLYSEAGYFGKTRYLRNNYSAYEVSVT